MKSTTVTATVFQKCCFDILERAEKGYEFIIEKDGRPAARLVPFAPPVSPRRVKHILKKYRSAFAQVAACFS